MDTYVPQTHASINNNKCQVLFAWGSSFIKEREAIRATTELRGISVDPAAFQRMKLPAALFACTHTYCNHWFSTGAAEAITAIAEET
jgi:hypothetical protein